ncbi:peptide maturation system acyl carrier-related protein [Paramaledivibacter caminithermalis]|uniref:peptide maturation system acyl carrier-related protein n=1 Tax=Paramaledivibacter caminithermalis TaxID=191027 RepID=UPI000932C42F
MKNCDNLNKRLTKIFRETVNRDYSEVDESFREVHLLGYRIGLNPRDLLYLIRDIEIEFNIEVPQEEIARGKFTSYNCILELIKTQLFKKG